MVNIYNFIIDLFQKIAVSFAGMMTNSLVGVLKIHILFTAIGMIMIIVFAVKKMQDNDLFTIKTIIGICLMMGYLAFFNWAVANPTKYYEGFKYLIEYPSNEISSRIVATMGGSMPQASSGNFAGGLDVVIQNAIQVGLNLLEKTNIDIGLTGIQGSLMNLLLGILYFVCQLIFAILIMCIVIVATMQLMLWEGLSIIFIALMFLPQTRGMIGKYIMFLITLTMYKPLVLTVAMFNTAVAKFIDQSMPDRDVFQKSTNMIETMGLQIDVMGYLTLGIIASFICVFLIKQVPEFISNVIGTSTNLGKGMATAATGAMAMAAGGAGALAAGSITAPAKAAYQGAGGGIGGVANAIAGIATMGASNKLGGNKAGDAMNNKLNSSKAGNFANNAVSKGISAGSNAIKGIANKASAAGKMGK